MPSPGTQATVVLCGSGGQLRQPHRDAGSGKTALQLLCLAQGWWLTGVLSTEKAFSSLSRCHRRRFSQGEDLSVAAELTALKKERHLLKDPLGGWFLALPWHSGILAHVASPCPGSASSSKCLFFPLTSQSMSSSKPGETPPSLGPSPDLPTRGFWSPLCTSSPS